jgi:hypothetical protein
MLSQLFILDVDVAVSTSNAPIDYLIRVTWACTILSGNLELKTNLMQCIPGGHRRVNESGISSANSAPINSTIAITGDVGWRNVVTGIVVGVIVDWGIWIKSEIVISDEVEVAVSADQAPINHAISITSAMVLLGVGTMRPRLHNWY